MRGLHAAAQLVQAELIDRGVENLRALFDRAEPLMRHPIVGHPQRQRENPAGDLTEELRRGGEEQPQPAGVERLLAQLLAETSECEHAGMRLDAECNGVRFGFTTGVRFKSLGV
jgi:hypothetical protein